jgi:epoxyqueuosine reductase
MIFDLKEMADKIGWSLSGVSNAEVSDQFKQNYLNWIKHYKGPQLRYLEKRMQERFDPTQYFLPTKSILCFGLYYFPGWAKGQIKISNYAWGRDYHDVLKEKLERSVVELKKFFGNFEYRIAVDTSPIAEKYWAQKAGLGWQGKNTLLLNPKFGSLFFLGEIFCSIDPKFFVTSKSMADHCGNCRRCLDACPTQALEPYRLIAERCISYLNLEHKGDFKSDTPSLEGWIAGCDICQEVCPWNQRLIPIAGDDEAKFFQNIDSKIVSSKEWEDRISDRAIAYVPMESWPRNLHQAQKRKTPLLD